MTGLSRRAFATTLIAAPLAASFPGTAVARITVAPVAIIPYARLNIGRFEVSFLSDGFTTFRSRFYGRQARAGRAGGRRPLRGPANRHPRRLHRLAHS